MEHRSLSFKYWVEFDDDGEIKAFYKNKYDCELPCKEYIVKLIPIQRNVAKELEDSVGNVAKTIENSAKKLDTEFKKVIRNVKGVLK